jgi:hypothetical protein
MVAEVQLALLRVGVPPDEAESRVKAVVANLPQRLLEGSPGSFEPFYVGTWGLLSPEEERLWRQLESNGLGEKEWLLREVEWCRRWQRENPSAAGTELVVAWEEECSHTF